MITSTTAQSLLFVAVAKISIKIEMEYTAEACN